MNPNKLAYSHGPGAAKVYFLTGWATEEDVNTGKAMSGSIARALTEFMRYTPLKFGNCYRATVIKELLSYRGAKLSRQQAAIKLVDFDGYEKQIFDELIDLQPSVIVPLDDLALKTVYPGIKSSKLPPGRKSWMHCYRGSILNLRPDWRYKFKQPVCVIPTYGPVSWFADPAGKCLANIDLHRIIGAQNTFNETEENWKLWICRGIDSLKAFIERTSVGSPFVAFDIETWGGLPWCISISFNGVEAMSVGLLGEKWHPKETLLVWKEIDKLLASNIPKTNQNIKYDQIILERFGFYVKNVFWDTMVIQNSTQPELPKGLDILTSIHTVIPYYKDEGKEYNPEGKRAALQMYNAKDAIAAWRVTASQQKDVAECNQQELIRDFVMPSLQEYKRIDTRGIQIDIECRDKLLEKYTDLYERAVATLQTLCGNPGLNPRSPAQLGVLLYEQLKYPKKTKVSDEGVVSFKTDKDTLDDLAMYHGEKNKLGKTGLSILRRIIVCRKLAGVINYLKTILHPETNAWHCTYTMGGTSTHRSSASKTIDRIIQVESFKNGKLKMSEPAIGRSLQTITKHGFSLDAELWDDFESKNIADDMRKMFVARPGYTFVEGDGSQAEARGIAVWSKNWALLADFDRKPNVHAKTAAGIFGIDAETITKKTPTMPGVGMAYYDLGKRIRHAGNLGIGEFRLAQMTHIDIKECKNLIDKFHQVDPTLRGTFHAEIESELKKSQSLTTPHGFYRTFFAEVNKKSLKEAYSYLPQCTISRHTAFSMFLIRAEMHNRWKDFRDDYLWFLVEAHDGLLAEVKSEWKERYLEVFKKIYERPIDMNKGSLPRDIELVIPCELSMGENWYDLEDVQV